MLSVIETDRFGACDASSVAGLLKFEASVHRESKSATAPIPKQRWAGTVLSDTAQEIETTCKPQPAVFY
jgi:hypothetical protein